MDTVLQLVAQPFLQQLINGAIECGKRLTAAGRGRNQGVAPGFNSGPGLGLGRRGLTKPGPEPVPAGRMKLAESLYLCLILGQEIYPLCTVQTYRVLKGAKVFKRCATRAANFSDLLCHCIPQINRDFLG